MYVVVVHTDVLEIIPSSFEAADKFCIPLAKKKNKAQAWDASACVSSWMVQAWVKQADGFRGRALPGTSLGRPGAWIGQYVLAIYGARGVGVWVVLMLTPCAKRRQIMNTERDADSHSGSISKNVRQDNPITHFSSAQNPPPPPKNRLWCVVQF